MAISYNLTKSGIVSTLMQSHERSVSRQEDVGKYTIIGIVLYHTKTKYAYWFLSRRNLYVSWSA